MTVQQKLPISGGYTIEEGESFHLVAFINRHLKSLWARISLSQCMYLVLIHHSTALPVSSLSAVTLVFLFFYGGKQRKCARCTLHCFSERRTDSSRLFLCTVRYCFVDKCFIFFIFLTNLASRSGEPSLSACIS